MGRVNPILNALTSDPFEVIWKPKGNSMTPKIKSGDQVRIKKVDTSVYRVGDAVYAKVHGSFYLHLITAIDETKDRYQISNNHGYVNGWTGSESLFGLCVEIEGKIIISDEEIEKRKVKVQTNAQ
jgi:phage repressor protein C with HTH and peptisase S24 domain